MSSRRLLSSLGLPVPLVSRLIEADFMYQEDVQQLNPTELSDASGLSVKESAEVIRLTTTSINNPVDPLTVLQLIENEGGEVSHIVSFCESIDDLLGGGIPLRAITEIAGTPGIGKTQMCLQACVSVQLPHTVGGVQGEAVYIDTEGSFTVGRLKDMSEHAVQHIQSVAQNKEEVATFSVDGILRGTHYYRCTSYIEVMAVVKLLPKFLEDHPNVRLVIIDSIAFHFRHDFPDMISRTGILCRITQDLIQLATKHNLAVIVTNQMTTRFQGSGESQLVAALGETWAHCPTIRLTLHWVNTCRCATLTKAPHRANDSINFQVTAAGIRDLIDITAMTAASRSPPHQEESSKKRKLNDT
ncbi:unnamed protein product [Meganyctiphanes norvegica]|uniref:DNA repair protein RAD51 homolog 3 n=1 Tax=Meganyctiphanes norvegica TaxID=48144 RepID=A0AAV2SAA4_MEGNR